MTTQMKKVGPSAYVFDPDPPPSYDDLLVRIEMLLGNLDWYGGHREGCTVVPFEEMCDCGWYEWLNDTDQKGDCNTHTMDTGANPYCIVCGWDPIEDKDKANNG